MFVLVFKLPIFS